MLASTTSIASRSTPHTLAWLAVVVAATRCAVVVGPMMAGLGRASRRQAPPVIMTAVVAALTIGTLAGIDGSFTFGRGMIPPPGADGIVGTADDVRACAPWIAAILLGPACYLGVLGLRARRSPWPSATR